MPEIKVLERVLDDWQEVYINGKLINDGSDIELLDNGLAVALINWINDNVDLVEIRTYIPDYKYDPKKDTEYNAPLHTITGETYWHDWAVAKSVPIELWRRE